MCHRFCSNSYRLKLLASTTKRTILGGMKNDNIRNIYTIYSFIGSIIYGILIITVGQILVKMMFSWDVSITETVTDLITEPFWTAINILPFWLLGLNLSFWIYKNKKWPLYLIFILGFVPLTFLYLDGYYGFEEGMQQQAWTWAALAMGFMVFFAIAWSLFLSFLIFIISWIIALINKITNK